MKTKEINKEHIMVGIIIIFAIIFRIYMWPNALSEVNCDEAMTALNAKSIAETGTDIYGTSFPVYFEAWKLAGQSALLTYLMAFCIKIFGFSIFSIRLPSLVISIIPIFLIYDFCKKVFDNKKIATIVLIFLAINPWHIMQSKWALDCNLFPHLMLIATYLLYRGMENKKCLYTSMLIYGISMYAYGIALYIVPFFLLIASIILYRKKAVTPKDIIISIIIYVMISTPIFLMAIVNYFKLPEIKIGNITIQYFKDSDRTNDMLIFSENKLEKLKGNLKNLFNVIVKQDDGLNWNSIHNFGVYYYFSVPFLIIGLYSCIKHKKGILILVWFGLSILVGILINDININRLNVIWYPIMILCGYGIYEIINKIKDRTVEYIILALYIIVFALFNNTYYKTAIGEIGSNWCWSAGLSKAIEYAVQIVTPEQIKLSEKLYTNKYMDNAKQNIYIKYGLALHKKENESSDIKKLEINKIENNRVYIITKDELYKVENEENIERIEFGEYLVVKSKLMKYSQ